MFIRPVDPVSHASHLHDATLAMSDRAAALELTNLSRSYGDRLAVDNLSFSVSPGEVVGFIGPNGAGKTTTIRMCMHLIRPTGGDVRVFGQYVWTQGPASLGRAGCPIESPATLPSLSGRENLEYIRRASGGIGRGAVERTLAAVGLTDRAGDRMATYSLGMRQRLGLGLALLADPDLLILDEPATGLDPAVNVEMWDLLRRLAADGRAILLSSHVLREVEETCDRVVINRGVNGLVREGTIRELVGGTGLFAVRVADPARALAMISGEDARTPGGRLPPGGRLASSRNSAGSRRP
jgi:ABC-2 type transport system ATP-binding protein